MLKINGKLYAAGKNNLCPDQSRDMVRGVMKARDQEARNIVLRRFHDSLLPLANDPFERVVLEYMDPIAWVESKLSGRKFADIVRSRSALSPIAA